MTVPRFVLIVILGLGVQAAVFAARYDDLLYLRQPAAVLMQAPVEHFARAATTALQRSTLTRAHLETIASVAQHFQRVDLEVGALRRRHLLDRNDRGVSLRLADALRRAGDLPAAEHLYMELLEQTR
jgi:hypothetical protein